MFVLYSPALVRSPPLQIIAKGEKDIPIDRDHEVERILQELEYSERQKKPAEVTLDMFKKKERKPKMAPPPKRSQIAALQRMDTVRPNASL